MKNIKTLCCVIVFLDFPCLLKEGRKSITPGGKRVRVADSGRAGESAGGLSYHTEAYLLLRRPSKGYIRPLHGCIGPLKGYIGPLNGI